MGARDCYVPSRSLQGLELLSILVVTLALWRWYCLTDSTHVTDTRSILCVSTHQHTGAAIPVVHTVIGVSEPMKAVVHGVSLETHSEMLTGDYALFSRVKVTMRFSVCFQCVIEESCDNHIVSEHALYTLADR